MLIKTLVFTLLIISFLVGWARGKDQPATGKVKAPDGVEIVYSAAGQGEPSLLFIHGGFADRSFWSNQLAAFATRHRVIALDLAGHGDSGRHRKVWGIVPVAKDVQAVAEKENLRRLVILGNSLGGPVAVEAARLMPDRVIAIVPVDTLQSLTQEMPASWAHEHAKAFRERFRETMKAMVRALFHPDVDPGIYKRAEGRMLHSSAPETAAEIMESLAGYDMTGPIKQLRIPIRCINGDLFPTTVEDNRKVYADFDAIVLKHTGHYPMLENPALFNESLERILKEVAK
ncbi:MAG: alpha/beta fold hydrolase [Acidobacteriota bacterium]